MKVFKIFFTISLFGTFAALGQSSDEIEIRRLETHWTDLLDKGDTTSLLQIWSKDYVVNNPNGKIVTPKEIVKLMKSGHVFPAVERIIEKITFNRDMAIVMGKELQQPASMTTDREEWIPRRFTNVWIRTTNGWRLAARQSSEVCTQ
jgi:ketosteroid isomerase-like protein